MVTTRPTQPQPAPRGAGKRAGLFLKQVRAQREAQLVQTATSVLLRKGCLGFRVEDVADGCGVAKGTCYQHFRTRPDLIAAAVRRLDEALAVRLLSPASHLTEPRQVLEWALLEAVDAQILAITQRAQQAEPRAEALEGTAWPCCLGVTPCPHGGAVRSSEALRRWTTRLRSPAHARRSTTCLPLLLALVPSYFLGLDGRGKLLNSRTIRSMARQLFKLIFPPEKLHR